MNSEGLTMLELIIVLMIAGITLSYAVPTYQQMILRQQMRISMDAFNTSLSLARNSVMSKNQTVVVCPSIDGQHCNDEKYELGWIVFVDNNENRQREKSSESLIWMQAQLNKTFTLRATRAYRHSIAYLPNGRLARGFSGNVTLCVKNQVDLASKIIMIASGRLRYENHSVSKCND